MDIVNLHIQNDKKSDFSRVYSIYFPKLVRFAREFVLSTEDAENIIQDIFIYLWERQELLNTLTNLNAFLFTLVKNKCIDQLRQQKLLERRKEEFKTVFDKEIQLKIYALQQFDENREIAEKLNISTKTVENQMTTAIRKLRVELKDYLPLFIFII